VDLLRDGQTLTTDVEDLQVAYYYDRDDDGIAETTNNEWAGMGGGEPNYAPGDGTATNGWPPARLREIRINFVTRSRTVDPNRDYQEGTFQTTENRAAVAGSDGFRRRVHTSTIRLRNIGTRDLPV
jgi:hypothetical protein